MPHSQELIGLLSTGVIVLDQALGIHYLNEAAESLIQRSLKQAKHNLLPTVIEIDSVLGDAFEKCLSSESIIRLKDYDLSLLLILESRRIDCQLTPIVLPIGDAFSDTKGVMMEIHEIGEGGLEHQIRERQQSGQTMIKGIAHEIRNPLGGIRGAAQLLSSELDEPNIKDLGLGEYTDIIIREVDRLSALVDRMQSSGKVRNQEPVNIHGVLEHVRQLVEADLSTDVIIKTDYDPSLPSVLGDEAGLIQVMINLIKNSIEAIDNKGKLILRTRIDRRVLDENTQQQVVRVSIEDNGRGIDSEMIRRVFEPLVTTKPKSGGLGLAISSQIVRQHNGLIDVQSEPGKTIFHVYLRIVDPPNA
ncbi:MAG: hypothetical protein GKR96_07415 [Gammaproteobacteria bacterium]|nr:hypothetical protein [Gammaproteobacteria bacterium]